MPDSAPHFITENRIFILRAPIIIIFYFENVAFFHAKLGSDVCPNFWQHVTKFYSTTSGKIAISQLFTRVLERDFGGGMPFCTNQFGLRKRHWDLETSSAVVEFPPPYHRTSYDSFGIFVMYNNMMIDEPDWVIWLKLVLMLMRNYH